MVFFFDRDDFSGLILFSSGLNSFDPSCLRASWKTKTNKKTNAKVSSLVNLIYGIFLYKTLLRYIVKKKNYLAITKKRKTKVLLYLALKFAHVTARFLRRKFLCLN